MAPVAPAGDRLDRARPVERELGALEHGDLGSELGEAAVDRGQEFRDIGHPAIVCTIKDATVPRR